MNMEQFKQVKELAQIWRMAKHLAQPSTGHSHWAKLRTVIFTGDGRSSRAGPVGGGVAAGPLAPASGVPGVAVRLPLPPRWASLASAGWLQWSAVILRWGASTASRAPACSSSSR